MANLLNTHMHLSVALQEPAADQAAERVSPIPPWSKHRATEGSLGLSDCSGWVIDHARASASLRRVSYSSGDRSPIDE